MSATTTSLPPALPGPALAQTLAAFLMPNRFDAWVISRYPTVIRMKVVGVGEIVALRDPDSIRELFTAKNGSVAAGEINKRVLPILGPNSIMAIDGERHLRMRRLLLPSFHGDAVDGYRGLIEEIAAREVDSWRSGEEFAIHPRMQAIALEVMLRVVLGVSQPARLEKLRAKLPKVLEANPLAFLIEDGRPWLASGLIGRMRPWVRVRRQAEALLRAEVADHRTRPDGRDDILAMLVAARDEDGRGLSDAELEDQLLTLLLAGHETTATSLAWCFERLLRNPRVLARLLEEFDQGREKYLDAVIKETMRTRPVVEAVWRVLEKPLEIGGHRLPEGTIVVPVIRATHIEAFDEPAEFRPERFLEDDVAPYSHIPFGGGIRRCLGAGFATIEMKTVLRTVLERVELCAPDQAPERVDRMRRFTASPARGARVVANAL
ncbi:MAG: cytochrome P450 [Solirubrobacterales bacterium]